MKSLMSFENHFKNETVSLAVPWDMKTNFLQTEIKLMDIVREHHGRDNKSGIGDLTRQLGDDAKILMLGDTSLQLHTQASVLHLLATAVKDSRKPNHKQLVNVNIFEPSFLFDLKSSSAVQRIAVAQQLSIWLQHTQTRESGSSLNMIADEPSYHLGMARLARKTGNYRLAERQIKLHFKKRRPMLDSIQQTILHTLYGNETNGGAVGKGGNIVPNGFNMPTPPVPPGLCNAGTLDTLYGTSKMMWAAKEKMKRQDRISAEGKAFSLLLSAVANEMDRLLYKSNVMFNGAPTVPPDALISVMAAQLNQITTENPGSATSTKTTEHYLLAKSLIQLARWLQAQPTLMQAAMCHSARLAFHVFGVEQSRLPLTGRSVDAFAGAILNTSCKLAPQLAKAHLELGNWAFNAATSAHGEARLSFADEECDMIRFYIKKVSIEADVLPTCKAIIGTKLDQRACAAMFGEGNVVSRIWKGANARLLAYCNSATRSYFTYIAMCGRQMDKGTIGTVRATLRILHLLITHHDALRHLILNEMLQTNELLWKDILPQLFARLNHPVRGVRDTLCTILERIAASAPHALCYPAIVGATQPIVVHCGDGGDDDVDAERVDFAEVINEEKSKRADKVCC
ncbi:unnamed protein product [Gongylonema pulchrum]|uniref:Separase n=1 Tax=Gongylonema pulchrum TaxID=637853 RepID=A0A183DWX5_9BILA|nr:unnamed protein product [Gongylonema pulchrum]